MEQPKPRWWLSFLAQVLLSNLGILVSILIYLLIRGLYSPKNVSDGLFLAGAAAIALGFISLLGYIGYRGRGENIYAQSAGDMNLAERTALMIYDLYSTYRFTVVAFLVGFLSVLLSVIAYQILNGG